MFHKVQKSSRLHMVPQHTGSHIVSKQKSGNKPVQVQGVAKIAYQGEKERQSSGAGKGYMQRATDCGNMRRGSTAKIGY